LTIKNKFFIISLEKEVQNGVFALNLINENYVPAVLLPAVLTFHSITPQSLSIKPKMKVTMILNSTTSRIFVFISLIFILISTNFSFSQTEEWNDSLNGNFILSLAYDANYLLVVVGSLGLVKLNKTMCDFVANRMLNFLDNYVFTIATYGQGFKLN
jgi:hypothetical protein